MKKQKLIPSLLMMGLMMAVSPSTFSVSASSGYGGGSGTESDPYLISTPEHLNQLQLDVNVNGVDTKEKYYQLVNDIDLSEYDNDDDTSNGNFAPIGSSSSISFKGTFDGKGYVISNLEVILPEQNYVGLFGYVGSATIQNVGLENVVIEGNQYVGGLTGYQYYGAITQSCVVGDVIGNGNYVGGLVGYQRHGVIGQSCVVGSVDGGYYVGGLIGYQYYGTVSQSYLTGDVYGGNAVGGLIGQQEGYSSVINQSYSMVKVVGSRNYTGGFVGYQYSGTINQSYSTGSVGGKSATGGLVGYQGDGKINQSYATGSVSGSSSVGGLVGYQGASSSVISESYATGSVSGSSSVGGLVGSDSLSTVENGYWDVETTGRNSSQGGDGLTTKQMTKRKAKNNMTGFDFETVWQESNGYPLLHWQTPDPINGEESDLTINGNIEATILSLTIPSESMTFALNPNEEVGKQFIASDFELINGSTTPLTLEIKSFEQVTDVLIDVESTKYSDWTGLNKTQSKDIALALVPKTGDGWLSLNEGDRWVADLGEPEIGTIKGNSTVSFGFEAEHGSSFTETLTPQYKLTFVFGLQD